jgi:sugar/nucleoside kinase (ribokinase family)
MAPTRRTQADCIRPVNAAKAAPLQGSDAPVVCLGEAIVDLVCERRVRSPAEADSFRPHHGGALANVAVACRRAGAAASLASGAGDDHWGSWLRGDLESEGVDLSWFSLVAGAPTAIALVTFDLEGEPRFQVYGEGIRAAMVSVRPRLEEAIGAAGALAFGSNTLVGEAERALTLDARRLALERGIPVLFDPNLRPTRWAGLEPALEMCRKLSEGAFLVRVNDEEARLITGESEPDAAAERLYELGARLAAVTLGAEGALVRGEVRADAPGVEVEVVSTMGAGDAFIGTLAAGLAKGGWEPAVAADALPDAVRASAAVCAAWEARPG